MTHAVAQMENLSKVYSGKVALNRANITLLRGHAYGLLGPNGSGKTTLMKILAGLHRKSGGSVNIFGEPISWKLKNRVAFMATENFIYDDFKVKDAVGYFCDMYPGFRKDEATEMLTREGICMTTTVGKLSSGMIAKLKLTLTAMREAELYMFDEPLNGIDLIARDYVLALLKRLKDEGKTQIISSHLVNEMEQVIDNAIFLLNGNVAAQGACTELSAAHDGKSLTDIYRQVYANV